MASDGVLKLCRQFMIGNIPASWEAAWPHYERWVESGRCEGLAWQVPSNAAEVFDLPEGSIPALDDVYKTIREGGAIADLIDFWHYMIYHLPEGMERNTNAWGLPDEMLDWPTRLLYLAAMVSGVDHALENFAATGVSEEVVSGSLSYIGYYTRDIKQKRGVWGIESMGWLSCYVRAEIFRLGRLTFKQGKYAMQYPAFRNRSNDDVMPLCPAGRKYRTDGKADGANGIHDPDAWTAALEISEDAIVGHPVRDCAAQREPVRLPADQWERVMGPGDDIVEVHIAGGSKMLHDDCIDAYRQAMEFYPAHYPDARFTGFTCWSWLLDPSLAKILPSDSNIVRFQQDFHLLPVPSDGGQCYDLVFGDSKTDLTKVTPTTHLQWAIIDHVSAGGRMCSAAGVITWDEAQKLTSK